MNKKSMVSVVVLTYQSSQFIIEALESVKAQTWKNIELIISDDASTDNTVSICSEFIRENKSRFVETKIITSKINTGIPANYNRGIKAASGEWIKFLDADDVLLENCVADYISFTEKHQQINFVISDVCEIDENSKLLNCTSANEGMYFIMNKKSSEEQLKAYARYPSFINSPTFFVKRSLLENIGYCDEDFRIYEDITMTVRTLISGVKIDYLSKPTVKYRIHSKSISRDKSVSKKRENEEYKIFKKYRRNFLSKYNLLDLSVHYETWLFYKYKGFRGRKLLIVLRKFSLFYWYMKFKGVKSY